MIVSLREEDVILNTMLQPLGYGREGLCNFERQIWMMSFLSMRFEMFLVFSLHDVRGV